MVVLDGVRSGLRPRGYAVSLLPVPVDAKISDWPRRVANAINGLISLARDRGEYPFEALAADPPGVNAGRVYFNTSTNKARIYNGATWADLT